MDVAGLILGILSIVGGSIPGVNTFPMWLLGIAGIIVSTMARNKAQQAGQPTTMATAGLVLSIIGTVLALIIWIACICAVGAIGALGAGLI